jgi:hypothetical protein
MMGARFKLVANLIKPWEAPEKARIWLKAIDPVKIINIMMETSRLLKMDFFTIFQLSSLYRAAKKKDPRHPTAAASVAVTTPSSRRPMAKKIMRPSGKTYFTVQMIFSETGTRVKA